MPRENAKTEKACARLRALPQRTGLDNNWLLMVLPENLGRHADSRADSRELDRVFEEIFAEYGQPGPASVKGATQ